MMHDERGRKKKNKKIRDRNKNTRSLQQGVTITNIIKWEDDGEKGEII